MSNEQFPTDRDRKSRQESGAGCQGRRERFCVIGNDYGGKDDDGNAREIVTSVWFVAFGALGESIASNARKGDQLILEARIRSNNWTDQQGEKQYDYSFVVEGFRFGAPGKAKRDEFEMRRDGESSRETLSNLA
jgi:single-strand DNA-binding protein